MNNLGNILLHISALSCILSIVYSFIKHKFYTAKTHTLLQFGLLSIALLKLVNIHINTDYSFANVVENSHELMPIIYKITGVWANHEGSLLLLVWSFSLISIIFSHKSKFNESFTNKTLALQSFLVLCFIIIIITTSNPFAFSNELLATGHGFNPLLQDIGLTIHPPILYLGYAGLSIPASISITTLLQKKINIDSKFLSNIHIWIAAPWALLSLGISLGSWWAYRELGWGGFWFWDPVENVSLIAWIASTISLHFLKLSKNTESIYKGLLLSNVLTFILSFFGMVLVRSGVLISVHSFAFDPEKGYVMLSILLLIILFSAAIFIKKWDRINDINSLKSPNFTTASLVSNIAMLSCACIIIIMGVVYPIFEDFLYNKSISVDEKFYTNTLSIFFLPIIYLAGIYSSNNKISIFILIILSSLILAAINYICEINNYLNAFYMHASIFLILSLLTNFSNLSKLPMILGHLGFAVLIIGGSLHYTYQFTETVSAQQNKSTSVRNYQITLKKIDYSKVDNYLSRRAHIDISDKNKTLGTACPEIRFYPIEKTFTIESAILHTIRGDIYLTLGELDKNKILIELQFKPFIYLLWIGSALMVMSIILYIFFKNGRIKISSKT